MQMSSFVKLVRRWSGVISIAFGMILVFISLYFSYTSLEELASQNNGVNNTISVLNQTANFALKTKDLQSNVRGYIVTGNTELLTSNKSLKSQITAIGDTLYNLVSHSPDQIARVNEVREITSQIIAFTELSTDVYDQYGLDSAAALIRGGAGITLFKRLGTKISEIQEIEGRRMGYHKLLSSQSRHHTILFMIGTGITGFFITILSIVFLSRDQRRQRALKREIYRKERMLNQYIEAIPDGVMVINNQKEILMLNGSGKKMLGITEDTPPDLEALTTRITLTDVNDNHRYNSNNLSLSAALNGAELVGKKTHLVRNGELIVFESNIRPICDYNGEIIGAISVFRDITDSEVYSKSLQTERDNAERSAVIKDVFLANISHEIRTPLNAILGFTYLLENEHLAAPAGEYISYIQVAGKNLLSLINDLLDISKIEVGEVHLDMQPTSLIELVDSVAILLSQKASQKGIVYQQILPEGLPAQVLTDKLRLTQVLLNICGNAVKFTEKGSVTMRVEPVAPAVGSLQTIRFTITDTGIGIAKEKTTKIFDRFVQASESTTREFGGTGLGLSIARSLVTLLNGTLSLESTLGKGTQFILEFPFEILDVPVRKEFQDHTQPIHIRPDSLRILAAEDNLLNQKLLAAVLKRINLPVVIVNNGQEALEALEKEHFDLILMDVQMPVMDGYTAIRNIRNKLQLTTPIITMTAHAMIGEKEECLRIGANSYISKPFKECELVSEIFRLTGGDEVPGRAPEPAQIDEVPGSMYVDQKYVNEITNGDSELIGELRSIFGQDYRQQLENIGQAAAEKDYAVLKKAIHKFRSSLMSIGLIETAAAYQKIENELGTGPVAAAGPAERLSNLEKEVNKGFEEFGRLYPS
ncbi:ATP-binding protein [Ravibacter arvi]